MLVDGAAGAAAAAKSVGVAAAHRHRHRHWSGVVLVGARGRVALAVLAARPDEETGVVPGLTRRVPPPAVDLRVAFVPFEIALWMLSLAVAALLVLPLFPVRLAASCCNARAHDCVSSVLMAVQRSARPA